MLHYTADRAIKQEQTDNCIMLRCSVPQSIMAGSAFQTQSKQKAWGYLEKVARFMTCRKLKWGVFKRWNGNEKHYSSTLRTRKCDRPHSRTEVKTTAGVWVRKYVLHSELKTLKGLHLVQVPSDMLDHYTEQRLLGQKEGVVQEERYWKRVENVLHRSVWDYWCRTHCLLCSCRSVAVRLSLAHLSLCAVW